MCEEKESAWMLVPPDVQDAQIIACLESAYGLSITEIAFLPLGADTDTAVYRVVADDATPYFLKLRRGLFPEAAVTIPHWLAKAGMQHLISPIATQTTGALWTRLSPFTLILYPFVLGRSGWEVDLSEQQWIAFGVALHTLHTTVVPSVLTRAIPHETYTARWRDQVTAFLRQVAEHAFDDPVAANLAGLLQAEHNTIHHIIARAEQLASILVQQPLEVCLCHGDIHAGNILIGAANRLYLVDWDTLVVAPKERDLMSIGGGIGGIWNSDHEVTWFYQGYRQTTINLTALTYYRYERIVQDIAVTCEQLLGTSEGGDDRVVMLDQLASQFEPNNVVDIAYATDQRLQAA
jgi:spectinomycin phosphotransferase